jgi:COP9 signalosome complex subunit 3
MYIRKIIDAPMTRSADILQPSIAIPPIRNAILRLDPSGSILTSSHLTLVKLALESQLFAPIVPVLEKFIFYFPGTTNQPQSKYICAVGLPGHAYITPGSGLTSKLKYQEVLEYFIFSATVFIGLRNWEMASDCLENVICYPVKENGVSKIMVEAYKKWVLVNLMLEGKPINLPSTTNNNAAKIYHIVAKPYDAIATLFESASAARLKAEADFGQSVWRDDGNSGLVLHVLAAYQKFQIRNLTNIYSKISIPEVINLTTSAETGNRLPSPQAAETLVENMIAEGSLHAILSRSPNQPAVLTFTNGSVLSEAEAQKELTGSMDFLHALTQEIKETDRRLTHEKEYIKYVQKQKKNAGYNLRDGANGSSGMDMDWNDIEDEDLMTSGI